MPTFALALLSDAGTRTYPLRPGRHVLGRSPQCAIQIDDPSVSREHAELVVGERVAVRDLGSANGTRIRVGSARTRRDETERRDAAAVLVPTDRTVDVDVGQLIEIGSAVGALIDVTARVPEGTASGPTFGPRTAPVRALCERAAATDVTVLLLGETGAGKEVFARIVHDASGRPGPFVTVNCAAVPAHLWESELFGHERGSFTGAVDRKVGLLEHAQRGTLFLDEVGELGSEAQAKLLRVLAERSFRPVGAVKERPMDVRFVGATNRDLEAEVASGRFRADLYHRIATFPVVVPPLRERKEEIVPLCQRFLHEASTRFGRAFTPTLSPAAERALLAHPFAGNVRELKSRAERAVIVVDAESVEAEHLGLASGLAHSNPPAPAPAGAGAALPELVEALERDRIQWALEACDGNQTKAAAMLGVSRRTLINRLEAFDLPRPRKRT